MLKQTGLPLQCSVLDLDWTVYSTLTQVLKQKYRNLEADLTHSHRIEWSLRAEIGDIQTQRSRSMQGSTFRGTLKYEAPLHVHSPAPL